MKPKGISIDKALDIMRPHVGQDLDEGTAEHWGIRSFDQITTFQGKEAVEEALKAYKAGLRRTPLDEGGHWRCLYEDAGRKLLWGIMQFRFEHGNGTLPISERKLRGAYNWNRSQAIMDRGAYINDLAETLLNQTTVTPEGQKRMVEEQRRHLRERF